MDVKVLGRSGQVEPVVLLGWAAKPGENTIGYALGKPVEQIVSERPQISAGRA
jgi:hypothetical protein